MPNNKRQADLIHCTEWARDLSRRQDWVILDTETTGLERDSEIVQIGVIDHAGQPLLNNVLIHPVKPIPPGATAIHGITNTMVENCPPFKDVWPLLLNILAENEIVIYNAAYDTQLIRQTARLYNITIPPYRHSCAMLQYAIFKGEWDEYRHAYAWPKLKGGDHTAIGDCKATFQLLKLMWK
jgi:DNA polymerase-3 subunit epsilon